MKYTKEQVAELFEKIKAVSESWGIIYPENLEKQKLYFLSEIGELATAILKNDVAGIRDGIGDVVVTILNAAWCAERPVDPLVMGLVYSFAGHCGSNGAHHGMLNACNYLQDDNYWLAMESIICVSHFDLRQDPTQCLEEVYSVISKRTGKTVDGVFIKDGG